jgi:hypothetical protein
MHACIHLIAFELWFTIHTYIHTYIHTSYLATLAPTTTKVDFHGGVHIKNITKNIKRKETKSTTICTLSKATVNHDGVSQINI